MAERDREHIYVPTPPASEVFTLASSGGGNNKESFTGDRVGHGQRLTQELTNAYEALPDERQTAGAYISFVSFPGLELALESLESLRSGEQPELVAVADASVDNEHVQIATVFIPDGKKQDFFNKLNTYVQAAQEGKKKNANLIEGIKEIRRATIRELWTDPPEFFPENTAELSWWEIWLRKRDGNERERFATFASSRDLQVSKQYLGFGDRTVVLLKASADQLAEALDVIDDLAELRKPHDVATFLTDLSASEQQSWLDDLKGRLQAASNDAPVVCILDTGVQDSHPLLTDSLDVADVHVVDPNWRATPTNSHGTEMAGLALFGDLEAAVVDTQPVVLRHRLESVKIMEDAGTNDPELLGSITAQGVDRPEIQAQERPRVFMLATTARNATRAESTDNTMERPEAGKPTSWSATIDALSFGRAIDDTDPGFTYLDREGNRHPRLFMLSAGNIRDIEPADDHLARSAVEPVEDPAQSWNAVTVGAYSATDDMSGALPIFADYMPLAPRDELSPESRTSVVFDRKKWPFKPDVVADGGNVALSPDRTSVDTPENLALLTTRMQKPGEGFWTTTRATSAATAQVAAIAGDVIAAYPNLRPETIRALIVHSAEWTEPMLGHINQAPNRTEAVSRLRMYGMGVPDASRALRSATDALTLVAESVIHPYQREGNSSSGTVREMNLHELPWPVAELENLGGANVRLRVTLSYFIEPNPSSRGWTGRYIYPSFGLRFAMKRPEDSVEAFRQRINTKAREEGEKPPTLDTEEGWVLGAHQQQSAGSLHTDIWTGTATDLASKGAVAVYPVAGWWKNRPAYDQSDRGVNYSLVVSIESPEVDIDLWTPVAQQVQTAVAVTT